MEVQQHGVIFEDIIVRAMTGLSKEEYQSKLPNAYTASMDIEKGIQSDTNNSIKTSKEGKSVGCGDVLRFVDHCKKSEFTIIVGAWRQITLEVKSYDCIYEFYINPTHYTTMWGGITKEVLEPFVNYVKAIEPGKVAQLANRKLWKQHRQNIYETYGRALCAIDAKIDSKTQRRVQCSFKIDELIKSGILYCKYETEYKGITLPYEQNSTARQYT